MRRHRPRAWVTMPEPRGSRLSWCAGGRCPGHRLRPLVSALVRQSMSRDESRRCAHWIGRARPMADAETAATFDVWRAKSVASRSGDDAL